MYGKCTSTFIVFLVSFTSKFAGNLGLIACKLITLFLYSYMLSSEKKSACMSNNNMEGVFLPRKSEKSVKIGTKMTRNTLRNRDYSMQLGGPSGDML